MFLLYLVFATSFEACNSLKIGLRLAAFPAMRFIMFEMHRNLRRSGEYGRGAGGKAVICHGN
jgi:hypothetical protein